MIKRSFFYILTLLALCVCLTGCLEDLPESSVPDLTLPEVTTTLPAAELTDEPATEATLEATTVPVTEATTEPAPEPAHTHDFSPATCTAPKACPCGATEGSTNGHTWKAATCSEPETCTVCGVTSGSAAGHTFSDGSCTSCGKSDPNDSGETMVWIPTRGGTKYHSNSRCSNMIDPEQVTESEALSRGFTPCKKCH